MRFALVAVLLVTAALLANIVPVKQWTAKFRHTMKLHKQPAADVPETEEEKHELLGPASLGQQSPVENTVRASLTMVGWSYSQPRRMENGFADCSSLIHRSIMKGAPHLASSYPRTTRDYANNNAVYEVKKSQMQRGDVMWKEGHVAFFIGNDQYVDAGAPGAKVSVKSFKRSGTWVTKVYRPKY